jgi:hypothetical protein
MSVRVQEARERAAGFLAGERVRVWKRAGAPGAGYGTGGGRTARVLCQSATKGSGAQQLMKSASEHDMLL